MDVQSAEDYLSVFSCTCSLSYNTWGSAGASRYYICGCSGSRRLCRVRWRLATWRSVLSFPPTVSGASPLCHWPSPLHCCRHLCTTVQSPRRAYSYAGCRAATSETRSGPARKKNNGYHCIILQDHICTIRLRTQSDISCVSGLRWW